MTMSLRQGRLRFVGWATARQANLPTRQIPKSRAVADLQERRTRSVQAELAVDGAHLGRLDQARMGDRHRMQRAFERALPEQQELLQHRERRTEVVFLPDVALQQPGMIRPPVEDVRSSEAVALKLLLDIRGSPFGYQRHGALQPRRTPSFGSCSVHCKPKC